MDSFEGEKSNFVVNPKMERQPVQITEDWSYMVVLPGTCNETGGRILNELEFGEFGGWNAVQEAVAVVQTGCDECMDEPFSRLVVEVFGELSDLV